ncbi:type I DNA topoisomerase [Mycoplasmopsis agassizii]|uniref:type I DNA topoisomerase n=1 Tax=Mycoplasmopsis agassizii TaxID=33922 RepID=UPI00352895D7
MQENKLVIVESPNKIKAIKKYLGEGYEVMASVGHVVELSKSGKYQLGIDLEKWEPKYVIAEDKKKIVDALIKSSKTASKVIIATDPDREGEAIGQNLVEILNVEDKHTRVKYNEITKQAIQAAFANETEIDKNLVQAQKVRRMLDRIIGFRLSKLMRSKFSNTPVNPSAGRVQSIALKLIVDREKEIEAFNPVEYYNIAAYLNSDYKMLLILKDKTGDKNWIEPSEVDQIFNSLSKRMKVIDIATSTRSDKKATPFKQSAFYKRSKLSARSSQSSAQRLFEGYGDEGLITYPRTDSTVLSQTFLNDAKKYITKKFGEKYWDGNVKGVAGDQNAHEAIRPTDLALTPEIAKTRYSLNNDDYQTYKLIYDNTLKSIMSAPVREITSFTFDNNSYWFKHNQRKLVFDGYWKAIANEEDEQLILDLKIGDEIEIFKLEKLAKKTEPPARYNDGSLIEMLDEIKVGRPSTFATTVNIIRSRQYVEKTGQALKPTEYGRQLLQKLLEGFPNIINERYTAEVESDLDLISEGKKDYINLMNSFYNLFTETMEFAYENLEKTTLLPEFLNEKCPLDQGELIYKNSRYGRFVGCSNYPTCTYNRRIPKQIRSNKLLDSLKKKPKLDE